MDCLFVYGTLRPNEPNAYILENIGGVWESGYIIGRLEDKGWGAALGSPGVRLDHQGIAVYGAIFYSEHLSNYWQQLDAFEGAEYERIPVSVYTENKKIVKSWVYALKK